MAIKLTELKTYELSERGWLWANSLTTAGRNIFVSVSGNVVSAATASTKIAWVSLTEKVYASDNQTVGLQALNYTPVDVRNLYGVTITGGTITVADEGIKYYNLSDEVTVDGTTESATPYTADAAAVGVTPLVAMQLKLVKFVSATYSIFELTNLI